MKLYFSPGSCALAPHIVAREAELKEVEVSRVTFSSEGRTTAEGEDYYKINAKGGYVPALKLDSGEVMTEGIAIQQYLANLAPDRGLMPEFGTLDYFRMVEWQAFISSEIHKTFGPLFRGNLSDEDKAPALEKLRTRYVTVDLALGDREYLLGYYSVADAYLYTIMRWSKRADIELSDCPNIMSFVKRMEERDGVLAALKEEGLDPLVAKV